MEMSERIKAVVAAVRGALAGTATGLGRVLGRGGSRVMEARSRILLVGALGLAGYALISHPPLQSVDSGEIAVRTNQLTGGSAVFRDGSVLMISGLHMLRRYSLRDQLYRPEQDDAAPFQSMEGLSLGVDLTVRYALDGSRVDQMARSLPDDINGQIVAPAVQGVIYKVLTRYTVKEIFSTKRGEIQQAIESELKPRLLADGIRLHGVQMGKVSLPEDYKAGMEALLAEELQSEKMRYTLELKQKQVQESALQADAEKVRRERAAEAAGNEQIIAARAQEEAMKHVLPFKQKQIEQRQLEAEAEKQARVKGAEANAQARVIEAEGEAASRRKLADAEVYRMAQVGKTSSEQMARDGALITKHPLLIQKAMADKLSDKISVIIAPPPADGGFIGSALLGKQSAANPAPAAQDEENNEEAQ
ncbi:SPFH domain-containing protein [Chitinimonas sp.]|uniref:SPFH domain-containing protein n=1 Tax=Chitinimonas sp. TaxID=1934313 RepID=UPI002F938B91